MAIYTDGTHVASNTSLDELHEFMTSKLNFKREWFQDHKHHPHYDIMTKTKREKALKAGAIMVSSKELVKLMWDSGLWIKIGKQNGK